MKLQNLSGRQDIENLKREVNHEMDALEARLKELEAENDKLAERNGEHAITNARLRKVVDAAREHYEAEHEPENTMRRAKAELSLGKALRELDGDCKCDCHKAPPTGWGSGKCCPDCGSSIVQGVFD